VTDAIRLSVAVPLCNEQESVAELYGRLSAVLDSIAGGPHEIVFVDDGSRDGTLPLLEDIAALDTRVVVVALSRNFGHQSAITAALDHVSGDAVVVMDGDLQDAPEAIPDFVARFSEGFDVVYARRVRRKEPWWLKLCYYLFYRVLARLSEVRLPVDAGDFGLMSRRVVREIRRAPEHQRYLRGLRTWVGFRQIGIDVEREGRRSGKSKYNAGRLVKLALDGLFAFSIVPLRAAAVLGALSAGLASLFALYALYARLFLDQSPRGFTALLLVVWFLSGIHLLFLGVIGEYVGRIYEEAKARPLYIVDRVIQSRPVDVERPRGDDLQSTRLEHSAARRDSGG
jgi:dolichol-phosphate mannosyltransferase